MGGELTQKPCVWSEVPGIKTAALVHNERAGVDHPDGSRKSTVGWKHWADVPWRDPVPVVKPEVFISRLNSGHGAPVDPSRRVEGDSSTQPLRPSSGANPLAPRASLGFRHCTQAA